jgi:hypothetical protein
MTQLSSLLVRKEVTFFREIKGTKVFPEQHWLTTGK